MPLTGWLPPPLPSQIRTMTVTGTGPIREIAMAPSKQHLLIATKTGDVQLCHIMSNSLVHTFKGIRKQFRETLIEYKIVYFVSFIGHKGPVTCMMVPDSTEYLLTGSEDNSLIVWHVGRREMKAQIL